MIPKRLVMESRFAKVLREAKKKATSAKRVATHG